MADHNTIARPYAKALFEIARDARDLGAWADALAVAADVVRDANVHAYLGRPDLDAAARAEFVARMCAGLAGAGRLGEPAGRNLLAILSENDRLGVLPEIAAQFARLKAEAEKSVRARLTTAVAVEAAQVGQIAQLLERKLGRKVELELDVDPTLLGGAIVRAEDKVIDGSVRSRLQRLAATLID